MAAKEKTKYIGRSVARLEDRPLLLGQGRFAADISFPGQWHMRIVRSRIANGKILAIDTKAAMALPGVHAVWTAADVAHIPVIDFRLTGLESLKPYRQHILARERVRYVGEPVAAVFAADAYTAEDAAELVDVATEQWRASLEVTDTPAMFDETHSNGCEIIRKGYGDVDAAFAAAHLVVALDVSIGRHSGVPMETRGVIAKYDEQRDILEMHGAAKVPHWNRAALAQMLGRAKDSVQLYEGHVGGGFGIRGEIYPEDVLACAAALKFRKPIKWIEDRREHLIAANHSRQQHHKIRAALDSEGHILGIDNTFFHDNGAYMRTHAATVPDLAAAMLPGPYRIPAYRATGHIRLTNKTPVGTYRAPGRYETTFARERLLDVAAAKLNIDPIELRRRNLIPKSAMPYDLRVTTLGTPIIYDSGDYAALLERALAETQYPALRKAAAARRNAGEKAGVGLAIFVEKSGLGPSDLVHINVDASGGVEVVTGSSALGQGLETVIAQICAETLGVDYMRIKVVHGQTERIEQGGGAYASRVTVMTGEATRRAADTLRNKALAAAAGLMQSAPEKLDIIDGMIVQRNPPGPSMSLGDLASVLEKSGEGLSAEGFFEYKHMVYPYGVHIAQVRVDTETGGIAVEKVFVAYDIGRAVNPRLVEGQIAGGVAQGLGGALYEEFQYDENGEPLSVTFADYLLPTMGDVGEITVVITEDAPSPLNSLGLKGTGEGGATAIGAAIAAAVDDALEKPGAVTALPITPSRLRSILTP